MYSGNVQIKIKPILIIALVAGFQAISLLAQTNTSKNLGFELGNFTNWTGYTWLYSTDVPSINTSAVKGIVNRRHTIISDTTAYDDYTGNILKKIPAGYSYSCRLGDEILTSDSNPRCWEQSLRYTLKVDSSNALLIMKFALVLQYASDHSALMEPRFKLTLLDNNGNAISDCSNYNVYSTATSVKGFQTYTYASSTGGGPQGGNQQSTVKWRDWTAVGADLSKYLGQTITIEFMAADCTGKYHFGYAYFVAATHPLNIITNYCAGDTVAKLTAPEGFETYSWVNSAGNIVGTAQSLTLLKPLEGEVYTCTLTSAMGCIVTLKTTIWKYVMKSAFSSYMLDCQSNKVQMVNSTNSTHGLLTYKWDFGDTLTSTEKSPQVTFKTSGLHTVKLCVANPPSSCADTLIQTIESFSPPLVGIKGDTTYCPNGTTYLKGYGAYEYNWSTQVKSDSIEIKSPGGSFWMIGKSSTGCTSDTIRRNVSQEPEWTITVTGDTTFCKGYSTTLKANGAKSYNWSTGDTTSSVKIDTSAILYLVGKNKRGCSKTKTLNITQYPLPRVVFTVSPTTISTKYNQVDFYILTEDSTRYFWNFGDGFTDYGTGIQHIYDVSNNEWGYNVTLRAINRYGCADSSVKQMDIVPFIPNVFTPNGDGINDVFMRGLKVMVFDRNGLLMYKGTSGWDGKHNGRRVDSDTYFYLVEYKDKFGKKFALKGYLTLIR